MNRTEARVHLPHFGTMGLGSQLGTQAILPGKQTQTDLMKVLTRNVSQNERLLSDITHARKDINDWWQDYNQIRPYLSLTEGES